MPFAVGLTLNDASAWRLELARRLIEPYAERAQIAVLGGSVAQGVADRWSDIDTLVYWDTIDRGWLETPRAGADGERFTWVEHYPGNACLEQYRFGTVKADVAHVRLGWLDELIDGVLSGDNTDTTSLDVLRGVQESIVLFGEERYEPIRARVLDYPEALRRSMVEAHLKFTPSWIYDGMGRDRGDLVVFYEYVLATMRNVVGVLAGLNRVYVAPEKLKRVGAVVGRMELAPPNAAARLDALLDLPREQVKPELDDLVAATLELVERTYPLSTRPALASSGRSRPSRAITRAVSHPAAWVRHSHGRQRQRRERAAERAARRQHAGRGGDSREGLVGRTRRRGRGACRGRRLRRAARAARRRSRARQPGARTDDRIG